MHTLLPLFKKIYNIGVILQIGEEQINTNT